MINIKDFVETLEGKPVAVFGLARSGLASVRALVKAGAAVSAWDDKEEARLQAQEVGAQLVDLTQMDLSGHACLVLAPGVPLYYPTPHPVVRAARAAGIEILSDIEILNRCAHGRRVIGVSGTNGKSTTCALIAHILTACGQKMVLGGNIGQAALDLKMPPKDGVFVLELSSYQLDLCPTFTPDIAVLLNITPDHLERHGTMAEYVVAKARIMEGEGMAIISVDGEECRCLARRLEEKGQRERILFSVMQNLGNEPGGKVYVEDGALFDGMDGEIIEAGNLKNMTTLHGLHNMQNAAASYAVCRSMGLVPTDIFEAMKNFPGLAHRQFLTRLINGVAYINDSKATNIQATATALACQRNIYWIVGGQAKEGGLKGLEPCMDRINHAFLIGEAAVDFAEWMGNQGVAYSVSTTMEEAVSEAHHMAQSERSQLGGAGVVLLSPSCASFDQFQSFEARGDCFTRLVEGLKGGEAA